jgi:hypothetical protein
VLGADPGLAGRLHLGPVGDKATQALHVLVVNEGNVLGAEDAVAPSGWEPATPPGTSSATAGTGGTARAARAAGTGGAAGTRAKSGRTAGTKARAGAAGTGTEPGPRTARTGRKERSRRLARQGRGRSPGWPGSDARLGGRRRFRAAGWGWWCRCFWRGHTGEMPPVVC